MTKTERFFKVLRVLLVIIAVGSFITAVGFMGHIERWEEESPVTVWDVMSATGVFVASVIAYKIVGYIGERINDRN